MSTSKIPSNKIPTNKKPEGEKPDGKTPSPHSHLAITYIRWRFTSAILHRGWWLVASLYLVVDAGLSPLQLVFLGTAQGITVIAFEIPTGVIADNYGRKRSMVIAHVLMGTAMLLTGLVTSFPLLVLTQMLWGLSWTFLSGADVAWLADELEPSENISKVLTNGARWGQIGAALGLIALGSLAWLTTLSVAMITAGILMLLVGIYVAISFREINFVDSSGQRLSAFSKTLNEGVRAARSDRTILVILLVTFLINGADEVFSRLFAKRLIELELPLYPDPIVWLSLLGLITLAAGAVALHAVENRLNNDHSLKYHYLAACVLGAAGLLLFALSPNYVFAMAGVIVVHGFAWNIARVISVIWINARSTSSARATIQSFLSQAENLGEVTIGFTLALVAEFAGIPLALIGATCIVVVAIALIRKH